MFAEAIVDFDEIEGCAYSGSELYCGQQAGRKQRCEARTTASTMAASSMERSESALLTPSKKLRDKSREFAGLSCSRHLSYDSDHLGIARYVPHQN